MIDVTDATFQAEVVDRSMRSVVIVDLWAPWCGPCRTLGPTIEKIVDETNGKAVLTKVNVDENPAISQAFRVQSIPAVYALKGGQIVDGFMEMAAASREHAVAEIRTAVPLTDKQRERLEKALSRATGRTVDAKVVVDPTVIGGVVARVDDLVFDGSVSSRLADAKHALGS